MMTQRTFVISIALVAGIVVLLNVLADEYFLRLDFTADKRYTLSKATRTILTDLNDPVTVTAYFSEDLPPNIERTRREFRELLTEYARASDDFVVYEFIDPASSDETEQAAMQSGVSPVLIDVRERDQMTQKRAFLGAVVQLGEREEVIPFLQPGAAMEYALSMAIKTLSVETQPPIAWIQGHGEPSPAEMPQAQQALSVLYSVEPLTFTDTTLASIPDRFRTALLIAPTDSIPPAHLMALEGFLGRGGRLLVAVDRVEGDFRSAMGRAVSTGLESWLADKGIEIEDSFVIDVNCGAVAVQQQTGNFRFTSNVSFPYLPIISSFAAHPIVEGIEAVLMEFASPIDFSGDTTVTFTPFAWTSNRSGLHPTPVFFDVSRQWEETDFPEGNLVVGATLEGPLAGSAESRMVVFSDGRFAVGGAGPQAGAVQPDNVSLLVNAVDWLEDDTGLVGLRTMGITARPLDPVSDGAKALLKYGNFLLPILFAMLYGGWRAHRRRRQRAAREQARVVPVGPEGAAS